MYPRSPAAWTFLRRAALTLAALGAIGFSAASPARAQDAVNANATPAALNWFGPDAGWDYTPGTGYSLSGVETKFASGSPSQLVTVEIYSGEPASGGTLLRSATFLPSGGLFSGASFAALTLTAGQEYFVGFRNIANLGVNVTKDPGATSLSATHYDFDFSNHGTYSSVEAGDFTNNPILKFDGAPVPEASTTVSFGLLLALGMGGLVVAAKRRKAGAAL